MGVEEGATWAGLEDGNRSWAPRAEDGAIWGIAVACKLKIKGRLQCEKTNGKEKEKYRYVTWFRPTALADASVSHGVARAAGSGHRVGITDAGGSGSGAS